MDFAIRKSNFQGLTKGKHHVLENKVSECNQHLKRLNMLTGKKIQFEVSQLTAILGGSLASSVLQQQAFPNHSPVCIYKVLFL